MSRSFDTFATDYKRFELRDEIWHFTLAILGSHALFWKRVLSRNMLYKLNSVEQTMYLFHTWLSSLTRLSSRLRMSFLEEGSGLVFLDKNVTDIFNLSYYNISIEDAYSFITPLARRACIYEYMNIHARPIVVLVTALCIRLTLFWKNSCWTSRQYL